MHKKEREFRQKRVGTASVRICDRITLKPSGKQGRQGGLGATFNLWNLLDGLKSSTLCLNPRETTVHPAAGFISASKLHTTNLSLGHDPRQTCYHVIVIPHRLRQQKRIFSATYDE